MRRVLLMSGLLLSSVSYVAAQGQPGLERTQTISLSKGWNAVFLEVEPVDTAPAKVFAGLPIDKAATLFENPVTNQFVTDTSIDLSESSGWGVWYAADLPESFLKSLEEIHGNRAYLVHAKSACVWRATGSATLTGVTWKPDAYNFMGFPVKSPGGPTFGQFFAGSAAHQGQTIYRLVNGLWKKVIQPTDESMRSGEAFWIFCDGPSKYQGPLTVETDSRFGLLLSPGPAQLVLRSACPHPLNATVEHVPGAGGSLPLSIVVRAVGDPAAPISSVGVPKPSSAWQQAIPPLEAGDAVSIPFECRAAEMLKPVQTTLLKITTDLGTESWVPVRGYRADLDD